MIPESGNWWDWPQVKAWRQRRLFAAACVLNTRGELRMVPNLDLLSPYYGQGKLAVNTDIALWEQQLLTEPRWQIERWAPWNWC